MLQPIFHFIINILYFQVDCAQSNKSAITEPSLISFEERNKQLKKRKEEYINKVSNTETFHCIFTFK